MKSTASGAVWPRTGSCWLSVLITAHLALTCWLLHWFASNAMPHYFFFEQSPGTVVFQEKDWTVAVHEGWWPPPRPHDRSAASASAADALNSRVVWNSAVVHIALAIVTYVVVTYVITPPFGRHAEQTMVRVCFPAKWSWALQEVPTLLNVAYYVLYEYPRAASFAAAEGEATGSSSGSGGWPSTALSLEALQQLRLPLLLFVIHYVHRSLIYPAVLPTAAHPVPLHVTWAATLYCLFNGRLQVLAGLHASAAFSTSEAQSGVAAPSTFGFLRCGLLESAHVSSLSVAAAMAFMVLFVLGSCLFFTGMSINLRVDYHLVELKRRSAGYVIPYGGWFDAVSCPNFFGEIVEWTGYAVVVCCTTLFTSASVCWGVQGGEPENTSAVFSQSRWAPSLAAASFVVYVLANLLPRGAAHHAWYEAKFGDVYTQLHRKAVLPGLY